MVKKSNHSDAALLEMYRVALSNAETHPGISEALSGLGYDAEKLVEGNNLLTEAREAFNTCNQERDERMEAYGVFKAKQNLLSKQYTMHRKKAKILFRKDEFLMERLKIARAISSSYVPWIEAVKRFYAEISSSEELQANMLSLNVTAEELADANTKVTELEQARSDFMKEKGQSQDATMNKDSAMEKLNDWMSAFYSVARIAFEKQPQLMEALGKVVKN